MKKPTQHFKLRKATKTWLSRIQNDVLRNGWKRMMVEAQLAAEERPAKDSK